MSNILTVFIHPQHILGAGVSNDPDDIGAKSLVETAAKAKVELLKKGMCSGLLCFPGVSVVRQNMSSSPTCELFILPRMLYYCSFNPFQLPNSLYFNRFNTISCHSRADQILLIENEIAA